LIASSKLFRDVLVISVILATVIWIYLLLLARQ
jgi:hypothetical protein